MAAKSKTAHYRIHQVSAAQFDAQFPHEDACKAYLMANRWPKGVHCPRCGLDVKPQERCPTTGSAATARQKPPTAFPCWSMLTSKKGYSMGVVRHGRGEYVCGAIHTNTIQGFWSIVKRGIVGTFHKVSKKYLPLYVDEFEFRYNNRENPDIFGAAIRAC